MNWARRLLVPVLFVVLLAGVYSAGINSAFSKPDKLKAWLHDSKFYDRFADYVVERASKVTPNPQTAAQVASDPEVVQAAKAAFPPQLLENSVNQFLDANYAWLQGKTDRPIFTIDLTGAKNSFALQLGQYAGKRFASLPVCTPAELAQFQNPQNINYLLITCRPAGLPANAVAEQVTQQTLVSDAFLKNANVTPETIGETVRQGALQSQGLQPTKPYYQTASLAPAAYRLAQVLPWIAGIVALLTGAGIVWLSASRGSGLRLIAIIAGAAGLVLPISKLVADVAFNRFEQVITGTTNGGQLQQSLLTVAHQAENEIVKFDLWFALVFLALAAGTFIYLKLSKPVPIAAPTDPPTSESTAPPPSQVV